VQVRFKGDDFHCCNAPDYLLRLLLRSRAPLPLHSFDDHLKSRNPKQMHPAPTNIVGFVISALAKGSRNK
jgi:hypothetical protein